MVTLLMFRVDNFLFELELGKLYRENWVRDKILIVYSIETYHGFLIEFFKLESLIGNAFKLLLLGRINAKLLGLIFIVCSFPIYL